MWRSMKIMNQHRDEFQLLRTTFVFCERGKLSLLISCLTFEPGLPRASRSVRENVNEERLFIAFCSQGKNSILFNILNTHDRPVRPFLRRSSCYAAVAEMGCRLQTIYDYYYSISRQPKKKIRPPPSLPDTSAISLSKHRTYHTFVNEHARMNNSIELPRSWYPSEFLPAALSVFKATPSQPQKLKVNE